MVEICDKPITNPYIPVELISEAHQTYTWTKRESEEDRSEEWEGLSVFLDGQAEWYLFVLLNDLDQYTLLVGFYQPPIQRRSKFKRTKNLLHKHSLEAEKLKNYFWFVFCSLKSFTSLKMITLCKACM